MLKSIPMKKTKIYLTGPLNGFTPGQRENFFTAATILRSQNASVVTALDFYYEQSDIRPGEEMDALLKKRLAALIECEKIVKLCDWEHDIASTFEVRAAAFLNIPQYNIDSFKNSINERNDSSQQPTTASSEVQQS